MPGELTGKKILLVDDDRDILAAIKAALEELGPEVFTATDGDSALTEAAAHSPDLVVLDQMLPKRRGFLVLEQLKQMNKERPRPRVLMITANPGTRHKKYAADLGIDVYLNKPFRMERLVESVKKLLE